LTIASQCADPILSVQSLFRRDPGGGLPALFAGRRVAYSYNTRVVIRAACDLLSLKPGDEVLAPAYNCGSELDPFLHAGLTVSLYPVDLQARIDPAEVEHRVTPRTRAVYMTHYFGVIQPETTALRSMCDRLGLWLIEDCALSLLSGTSPVEGQMGDISLFCFYKFFPVHAGGAMVINNPRLPDPPGFQNPPPRSAVIKQILRTGLATIPGGQVMVSSIRRARSRKERHDPKVPNGCPDMPASYYFDPTLQGARISLLARWPIRSFDVSAAITARTRNYATYLRLSAGMSGVKPLYSSLPPGSCPLSFPVLVSNRDQIAADLQSRGIGATPWWAGYHQGLDFGGFEDACYLKDHVLSLPVHQGLGQEHISYIMAQLHALMRD
jgi:perosamine synthetase